MLNVSGAICLSNASCSCQSVPPRRQVKLLQSPAGTDSPPPTVPCERDTFLIGMIGDQAKIPRGPDVLDRPTPWEIRIAPVGIVLEYSLFRSVGNPVFAWEPREIGEGQFAPRFQPRYDQGNHPLGVEVEPTLSTTDDIEGLRGECYVFSSTGYKADREMFLSRQLLGSNNLCVCDIHTDNMSTLWRKSTR